MKCPRCAATSGFKFVGLQAEGERLYPEYQCNSCGRGDLEAFGCVLTHDEQVFQVAAGGMNQRYNSVSSGTRPRPGLEEAAEQTEAADQGEMSVELALARIEAGYGGLAEAQALRAKLQEYERSAKWEQACEQMLEVRLGEAETVARQIYRANIDLFRAFNRQVPNWVTWVETGVTR